MQNLMKINLKLNLKNNFSRMPLQNNMKRKVSLIVFSHCDKSSNNGIKEA